MQINCMFFARNQKEVVSYDFWQQLVNFLLSELRMAERNINGFESFKGIFHFIFGVLFLCKGQLQHKKDQHTFKTKFISSFHFHFVTGNRKGICCRIHLHFEIFGYHCEYLGIDWWDSILNLS